MFYVSLQDQGKNGREISIFVLCPPFIIATYQLLLVDHCSITSRSNVIDLAIVPIVFVDSSPIHKLIPNLKLYNLFLFL